MRTIEELRALINTKIDKYDYTELVNLALQINAISFKEYIQTTQIFFSSEFTNINNGYSYGTVSGRFRGCGRKEGDLITTQHTEFTNNPINVIDALLTGYQSLSRNDNKFPMIALINKGCSSSQNKYSYEFRIGW